MTAQELKNSSKKSLTVGQQTYQYYDINTLEAAGLGQVNSLPVTLKILLENLLRHQDGDTVKDTDIKAVVDWLQKKSSTHEIAYRPARVLMQDLTGVPGIVDLAAMRTAMQALGQDPEKINPLSPVDLVIDHSVQVDKYGISSAYQQNTDIEMQRNHERYEFLRWGQKAFQNFSVVPPGTGICHQVNLEFLAKSVWSSNIEGELTAYPDTCVGTDSHTTMINALGVLGWGVGGIEAEAGMLGQPVSMLIPEVIGMKLTGKLNEGITATDLVLTVTEILRQKGVVGKFVEFFGPGLSELSLADRATIANMAPEYGATCGFFPVDNETLNYLRLTGRSDDTVQLVETYSKVQGLWRDNNSAEPVFTDVMTLDLGTVVASLAGPKRPQDRVALSNVKKAHQKLLTDLHKDSELDKSFNTQDSFSLHHGDVVIAAITSCTNTSNPAVLMAAGLVAKKALAKGLTKKPWVKTSLAPGSKVVTTYLEASGLQSALNDVGFNLVGYGCTTCIGNSGPLSDPITESINQNDIVAAAVLSGNRNFEGRVHPLVKSNWLASPPLVVAFAIAGTTNIDLTHDPIGFDQNKNPVYLKDIWPSNQEVASEVAKIKSTMFSKDYNDVFKGDEHWQAIPASDAKTYAWPKDSTYIQHPPYFTELAASGDQGADINKARILALFGDSITTDHISPAGSIKQDSPAGKYLQSLGVTPKEFNSYGARRGNHQVMIRGTFANIRIRNEMLPGVEGGMTKHFPSQEAISIFDAAMQYQQQQVPLVVIAGKEYGTGSSRDWAAKGTRLLGIKAVIAESFERIHRSNLIGMGVLPFEFMDGVSRKTLALDGSEEVSITELKNQLQPGAIISATITRTNGEQVNVKLRLRIDTSNELRYYQSGGILQYVLQRLCRDGK